MVQNTVRPIILAKFYLMTVTVDKRY